jgi:predicted DNA-binding transcriptional regulator
MVRIQIQLEEEQAKRLRQIAREQGLSVSELVRQSVDSLFRSQGMLNREELKQHAMDTVGSFHSGSRDISTHHDRYLERR